MGKADRKRKQRQERGGKYESGEEGFGRRRERNRKRKIDVRKKKMRTVAKLTTTIWKGEKLTKSLKGTTTQKEEEDGEEEEE